MDKDLQEQSKRESLVRGEAFEELVRTKGWTFVKAYFENKVKALATSLLVEDKPITEYVGERYELVGLRKLFGYIEQDIKVLKDENKTPKPAAK
jgi:hypothetical protein